MRCLTCFWICGERTTAIVKKKDSFTGKILRNNLYAVKQAMTISKKRVICSIIKRSIEYFLWVFYSAFFVRFILDALEEKRPLREILTAILLIGGVSLILELFLYYCDNVLFPCWNIKIFHHLYNKIYRKAENVELACYEDNRFYDKFSTALDEWERNCATVLII